MSAKKTIWALPYAGGDKHAFIKFKEYLPTEIELITPELPGRGGRFQEELLIEMDAVVEEIWRQKPDFEGDFLIYGHSMGALAGYLLVKKMIEEGHQLPVHLVASGRVPPQLSDPGDKHYSLETKPFWKAIQDFGGCPESLLQYPELMDLFEPVIKADLKAIDSLPKVPPTALPVPITMMHGNREFTTVELANQWAPCTSKAFQVNTFDGNHFFILEHGKEICRILVDLFA